MLRIEIFLNNLKKHLGDMLEVVLEIVSTARDAIINEDSSNLEKIFKLDRRLDQYEKDMDQRSIELLALINPVAADLRYVYSIIKLDVDLERIGDECKNLARELEKIDFPLNDDIKELARITYEMVAEVLDALKNGDTKKARNVILRDDEADKLEWKILQNYESHLSLAFAAKSLERIADHATNIAENVIFAIDGEDLRHENTLANRMKNE